MNRRRRAEKAKVQAKRPPVRKPAKDAGGKVRDLEKRLAESLEREKATGEILQEKDRMLTEALEQQTATAEILRVISRSPTDAEPVFDAIARRALSLCRGQAALVVRYDGGLLHLAAHHNLPAPGVGMVEGRLPRPADRTFPIGVAVLDRVVCNVPDLSTAPQFPKLDREFHRGLISVPLLHEGQAIGAIGVSRAEPGGFSDRQIALLQTFADQAVIAIENVRLFTELQEKNRALTDAHTQVSEALERQTAAANILQVISQSRTEVQPVFEAIVRSSARLCRAAVASVTVTDGRMLYLPANYGSSASAEAMATIRARFPRPLDSNTAPGAAILARSIVQVPDVREPSVVEFTRQAGQVLGYRSLLSVPLLREGAAVGAITVHRVEPGLFSDSEVELLKTFADQAVIAIENVRLFNELRARNTDL